VTRGKQTIRGKDLRQNEEGDWPKPDCKRAHVGVGADNGEDRDVKGEGDGVEDGGDNHSNLSNEKENPTASSVHEEDGNNGEEDVEDSHRHGEDLGVLRAAPHENVGGVIKHSIDPGKLQRERERKTLSATAKGREAVASGLFRRPIFFLPAG